METFWDLLSYPRLCGLLARKPTRLGQAMHNAGFAELGLPFAYVAFDTEDTAHALDTMRRLGFRGFSLTIPHKETALPLLDECSREASVIGAVNTVVNSGKSLFGENTDWIGVRDSLLEHFRRTGLSRVFLVDDNVETAISALEAARQKAGAA